MWTKMFRPTWKGEILKFRCLPREDVYATVVLYLIDFLNSGMNVEVVLQWSMLHLTDLWLTCLEEGLLFQLLYQTVIHQYKNIWGKNLVPSLTTLICGILKKVSVSIIFNSFLNFVSPLHERCSKMLCSVLSP